MLLSNASYVGGEEYLFALEMLLLFHGLYHSHFTFHIILTRWFYLSSFQCYFLIGLPGSCLHVLHVWLFLHLFVQASCRTLLEYSRKFTFQLLFSKSLLAIRCTHPACLACFVADVFLCDAFICFFFFPEPLQLLFGILSTFFFKVGTIGCSVWCVSHRIWVRGGAREDSCILCHWVPGQGWAEVAASVSSSHYVCHWQVLASLAVVPEFSSFSFSFRLKLGLRKRSH